MTIKIKRTPESDWENLGYVSNPSFSEQSGRPCFRWNMLQTSDEEREATKELYYVHALEIGSESYDNKLTYTNAHLKWTYGFSTIEGEATTFF